MTKKRRSVAELEAENDLLRSADSAAAWGGIGRQLAKWGSIAWIATQARYAVEALAGKTTLSSMVLEFTSNLSVSVSVAWVLAAGGVTFGLVQRQLRHRLIRRQGSRLQELERLIDPGRTTSGLTTSGETHPRDAE